VKLSPYSRQVTFTRLFPQRFIAAKIAIGGTFVAHKLIAPPRGGVHTCSLTIRQHGASSPHSSGIFADCPGCRWFTLTTALLALLDAILSWRATVLRLHCCYLTVPSVAACIPGDIVALVVVRVNLHCMRWSEFPGRVCCYRWRMLNCVPRVTAVSLTVFDCAGCCQRFGQVRTSFSRQLVPAHLLLARALRGQSDFAVSFRYSDTLAS